MLFRKKTTLMPLHESRHINAQSLESNKAITEFNNTDHPQEINLSPLEEQRFDTAFNESALALRLAS